MSFREIVAKHLNEVWGALSWGVSDKYKDQWRESLAAIEVERPARFVSFVEAYEDGFEAGRMIERERLAKAAEAIAAMEPEQRPVWLTHAEWREVADWIRSQ